MNPETTAASGAPRAASPAHRSFLPESAVEAVAANLVAAHGASQAEAIRRGARQVAERWWSEDGDTAAFAEFCERNYLSDEGARARAFSRISDALEQIDGLLHELHRELRRPMDTDTGPLESVDLSSPTPISSRTSSPISSGPRSRSSPCSISPSTAWRSASGMARRGAARRGRVPVSWIVSPCARRPSSRRR